MLRRLKAFLAKFNHFIEERKEEFQAENQILLKIFTIILHKVNLTKIILNTEIIKMHISRVYNLQTNLEKIGNCRRVEGTY
jgi:hypothetical protein